jgi:hypothetical protein
MLTTEDQGFGVQGLQQQHAWALHWCCTSSTSTSTSSSIVDWSWRLQQRKPQQQQQQVWCPEGGVCLLMRAARHPQFVHLHVCMAASSALQT